MAPSAHGEASVARSDSPSVNGAALRRIRLLLGISLTDMAERVGTSASHLSNVESGRRGVSWPLFHALATELDTDKDALLNRCRHESAAA